MYRCAALCALVSLSLAPAALGQLSGACTNGTATHAATSTAYACEGVNLLSRLTVEQMNDTFTNDIWGWTDSQTGKEYALVGLFGGTAFVDVSTPSNPIYLGKLPTHASGNGNIWRDIKVYRNKAYIVSEANGHGMQVFDLTQLRNVTSPRTFSEAAHYNGIGSAHNIAINEATGYAYVVGADDGTRSGCAGGLHMINISGPVRINFAGCFAEDGYTHDVQCVTYDGPDADYTGREICFASNVDTVTIVDVTVKSDPVLVSQMTYPNINYTHQGWLTEDSRYFIGNDEGDESFFTFNTRTLIFDVEDLDAPEFLNTHLHPVAATDHNLYVRGPYVFEANYRAGLRILDASSIAGAPDGEALTPVAVFDTVPSSNSVGTGAGAWSVYPFFESGTVVVSDQEGGLFVLDPQLNFNPTDSADTTPEAFALSDAYPNPFSGRTQIDLTLAEAQTVTVAVYDVLGRRVANLFEGMLGAGEKRTVAFEGSGLPAGLYFIRATGDTFAETRRVALTR